MGDVYIATLDPATGKVLTPPEKIPQRFEGMNASPDWSPDGKYLVYMSVRGLATTESVSSYVLVIHSIETGEERELPMKRRSGIHRLGCVMKFYRDLHYCSVVLSVVGSRSGRIK